MSNFNDIAIILLKTRTTSFVIMTFMCFFHLDVTAQSADSIKSIGALKQLPKDSNKQKLISLHGTILIEGQLANRKYLYQQVPQSYLRCTVSPELNLLGIPFNSQFNLTTEQASVNYNLTRFKFSLDVHKLNKLLSQKLKNRIADSSESQLNELRQLEDTLKGASDIAKKIEDLGVIQKASNRELAFLKKGLPDEPSLSDSLESFPDLKYRLQYKEYFDKTNEYEQRQKELDSLRELKEVFDRLEKRLNTLKRYSQYSGGLDNYKQLPENYRNHSRLSKAEKLLLSIRRFELGTINSGNSAPYAQGLSSNGFALENSYRNIYTQLQAGVLQQNLAFGKLIQDKHLSYLYSVKAGYGMPENSHLHVGRTKSGDIGKGKSPSEENSISVPENISLWSADGKLYLNSNIHVFGNWAMSQIQGSGINTFSSHEAPSSKKPFQTKWWQAPESYYSLGASGEFKNTKIFGQTSRIGTAFYSPQNPYFRNDLLQNELKISQKLYKNFITTTISYKTTSDNLLSQKRYTTYLTHYKASLSIRFKKLPSFIVSYTTINQMVGKKETKEYSYSNRTSVYTLTTVYTKRIYKNIFTSSITYMYQETKSKSFEGLNRTYNNIITNLNLSNQKGDNISLVSTIGVLQNIPYKNTVLSNQAEANYQFPDKEAFTSTLGIIYTYDDLLGTNAGIYVKQSVSFWEKSRITLGVQQNMFKNIYINKTTFYQTVFNIQLIQQW